MSEKPNKKNEDWFKSSSKKTEKETVKKVIKKPVKQKSEDVKVEEVKEEKLSVFPAKTSKVKSATKSTFTRFTKVLGFNKESTKVEDEQKESKIAIVFSWLAKPFISGPIHRFYKKIRTKNLLTKILYTLMLILFFRVLASFTMPGIVIRDEFKSSVSKSGSFVGLMDMMGGGGIRTFSIVALGLGPYISSSMIMQFLSSELVPPLHRLSKSGPAGKRKINIITRCFTLAFAIVSAVTFTKQLLGPSLTIMDGYDVWWFKYVLIPTVLIAGAMFTLFLGEQITNKGVGNGTSLIIFSGIAASLPTQIKQAWVELVNSNPGESSFIGALNFIIYFASLLVILFVIGFLYLAERRIPIQQTGSGLQMDRSQMSHLPMKLNPAGVMPIFFSMVLVTLPTQFSGLWDHQNEGRIWLEKNFQLTAPIGISVFIVLTILFTVGLSYFTFNPSQIADGFKKNGTFIPGVRPGEETEQYLWNVLTRLSIFSAIYLSILAAIPFVEQKIGLSSGITFSGTSLIIIVTVAIETINQLKARDKTRKLAKARQSTIAKSDSKNAIEHGKGLLW